MEEESGHQEGETLTVADFSVIHRIRLGEAEQRILTETS